MTNFNLERTLAPRRTIPWWIYLGAVIIAALLIFALVKALPGKKATIKEEPSPQEEEVVSDQPVKTASEPVVPAPPPVSAKPIVTPAPVSPPPSTPPTVASTPPAAKPAAQPLANTPQLQEVVAAKDADDYVKARELGLAIWKSTSVEAEKTEAENLLGEIDIALVLTPRLMPEKVEYTVQSGDSLEKIAKKFGTTIELLRVSNNVKGSMIRIGDRLRIFQGKFSVIVSKSANDLVVMMNNDFFKRYRVGTGQYNKTPVGDFIINDRIAQPTWWRPDGKSIPFGDPENLIGTHWLSLNVKGYGIHGTWEPDSIGKQSSAGCVRLLNEDIEQLFTLLTVGTPVSIHD